MMFKVAGIGVTFIFLTVSVLFVILIAPLAVGTRDSASTLCAAMLGIPPSEGVSVMALSGPDAEIVAALRITNSALSTGEDAYRFVTSLNTVTNWRHLPPAEVAAWSVDPATMPLPNGAVIDAPWPAPAVEPNPDIPENIAASVYESACATVLHRADHRAKTTTSSQVSATTTVTTTTYPGETSANPLAPITTSPAAAVADPQRVPLVAAVSALIGTQVTEYQLWQAISPRADRDAKEMLFEELANSRPVSPPQPGDLACYDFTTSGPSRCALVIAPTATGLPQIAATDSAGALVAQVVPTNVTYIRPGGYGAPELLPTPAPTPLPDEVSAGGVQ